MSKPEPWLRGIVTTLNPVVAHLLRASEQIREESAAALESLDTAAVWARPHGMTSAGFHARHLAGSTHRLCVYLEGNQLSQQDLAAAAAESAGDETTEDLMKLINDAFARYEEIVRTLGPEDFGAIREIGRQRLPATAVSLAIHIAEHGQRHTGQLIAVAKLASP